jgi:glycosyltransferase involved in cell wall biosynthesis
MFRRGSLIDNLDVNRVCVGVHSHNSWLKRGLTIEEVNNILSIFPAKGFISKKLIGKFPNLSGSFYTPTGYNPRYFRPSPLPPMNGKLKVCWAGDPEQSHHGGVKGYFDFILPVIESNDDVEIFTTTKSDPIEHSMMGEFYSKGHLYVNMSANEGSPMPVLESMACGRPVISTNVGIIPEILDESSGWVIPRTKEALNNAIYSALENLGGLQEMGISAYKNVEERVGDWSAMHYEMMFDYVYENAKLTQLHR